MAQRTTSAKVQAILGDNYDGSKDLAEYLATALAVTDWLEGEDDNSVLTATLLERIECYLTAHYYLFHDQMATAEKIGGGMDTYQGTYGEGFKGTKYGQAALELDVSGNLLTMGKPTIQMAWLGLPPSEQTDYEDRD